MDFRVELSDQAQSDIAAIYGRPLAGRGVAVPAAVLQLFAPKTIGEPVAFDLPLDRRIRVEEPVEDDHAANIVVERLID